MYHRLLCLFAAVSGFPMCHLCFITWLASHSTMAHTRKRHSTPMQVETCCWQRPLTSRLLMVVIVAANKPSCFTSVTEFLKQLWPSPGLLTSASTQLRRQLLPSKFAALNGGRLYHCYRVLLYLSSALYIRHHQTHQALQTLYLVHSDVSKPQLNPLRLHYDSNRLE